jgi:hypothetical protein
MAVNVPVYPSILAYTFITQPPPVPSILMLSKKIFASFESASQLFACDRETSRWYKMTVLPILLREHVKQIEWSTNEI